MRNPRIARVTWCAGVLALLTHSIAFAEGALDRSFGEQGLAPLACGGRANALSLDAARFLPDAPTPSRAVSSGGTRRLPAR